MQRAVLACGRKTRWITLLVNRVLKAFPESSSQRTQEPIARFIEAQPIFRKAVRSYLPEEGCAFHQLFWVTPTMSPRPGAPESWQVPPLTTSTALANWLNLKPAQLDWFADCHGFEAKLPEGSLRHYMYRWIAKRARKYRLLEIPKPRLKSFQRQILHEILDRIPCHDAVHGFRKGRSIVTYAGPHCGQRIVVRFDLRNFFPSIPSSRIHAIFKTAGYPTNVARLLTGLCTGVVPGAVLDARPGERPTSSVSAEEELFRVPHLPQGAPTSPALANLCAYRLDCRLQGLAQSLDARYTRYADDLAFSGGEKLERAVRRLEVEVCTIALEEGFELHLRKSRFMRQGVRQQLVGVVLNAHPNIRRDEYDRLKAILHNCVRFGPASQNREGHADFRSHLLGRIAHLAMLNLQRGEKLRKLFERMVWE